MKEEKNSAKEREDIKLYLEQINWDWLMLKGQLILGVVLVIVLLFYFWFAG